MSPEPGTLPDGQPDTILNRAILGCRTWNPSAHPDWRIEDYTIRGRAALDWLDACERREQLDADWKQWDIDRANFLKNQEDEKQGEKNRQQYKDDVASGKIKPYETSRELTQRVQAETRAWLRQKAAEEGRHGIEGPEGRILH